MQTPREREYRDSYMSCPNNILALSDAEKIDLTSRIESHQGVIRAYIHPYFLLHSEREYTSESASAPRRERDSWERDFWRRHYSEKRAEHPSIEYVESSFREAVRTHGVDKSPLVVFEEGHRVSDLVREFREVSLFPYIVPTEANKPNPLVKNPLQDSAWETLRELLRELGVRHIDLGGMLHGFCVEVAQNELQKAFHVEISLPVHPPENELTVDHFGL